jgi:hypothetical protein
MSEMRTNSAQRKVHDLKEISGDAKWQRTGQPNAWADAHDTRMLNE